MSAATPKPFSLPKIQWALLVIVLFHAVGAAGFLWVKTVPLFIRLVPFHLLLMLGVLLAVHQPKSRRFFGIMVLIMLAGWTVELAGVRTGAIFGEYRYGATLGLKVLDIPLMIGVNWFLLVYSAAAIVQRLIPANRLVQALAGAALLVLIDALIEPAAICFDYWSWADAVPPLKNYTAWFAISFVFLYTYVQSGIRSRFATGCTLYLAQLAFFAALLIGSTC
ncbi:MAG: carotenoid biosynthesis protein [Mucilaginibacter polytrichastri]|nr:carotenoid biosynthesis protein [Mucilaginibacter polytrichastri]